MKQNPLHPKFQSSWSADYNLVMMLRVFATILLLHTYRQEIQLKSVLLPENFLPSPTKLQKKITQKLRDTQLSTTRRNSWKALTKGRKSSQSKQSGSEISIGKMAAGSIKCAYIHFFSSRFSIPRQQSNKNQFLFNSFAFLSPVCCLLLSFLHLHADPQLFSSLVALFAMVSIRTQ